MIKILGAGLPTKGFLKIGMSSKKESRLKGAPMKFDHIEVTGRERDKDGRLVPDMDMLRALCSIEDVTTCGGCERSKQLGFPDGLPTRLPVFLPYNEVENIFPHRLALYRGGTAFCTGDGASPTMIEKGEGEGAQRLTVLREGGDGQRPVFGPPEPYGPCGPECADFQSRRCKPNGRLSVILAPQNSIGNVYQFKTTSWNSIRNLDQGLRGIAQQTAGTLQWVPMWFSIHPQTVQPAGGGPANTAMIASIEHLGTPTTALELVVGNLRDRAPLLAEVRRLESGIAEGSHWVEGHVEAESFEEEFYPDGEEGGAAEPSTLDEADQVRLLEVAEARAEALRAEDQFGDLTAEELLAAFLGEHSLTSLAEILKTDLPELLMALQTYSPPDPFAAAEDPFADRPGEGSQPAEPDEEAQGSLDRGLFEGGG
jgi:hypothetical protein